uniref:Sugar transporter SWEET n=1 Tax=Parastrongyloides trichosuri TaxID=131310 RepID=A0A0N4ZCF2_PARTI
MNFTDAFGVYVGILGISLCLLPLISVKQWVKKNSSDGFPSAGYHTGTFINAIWLKFGLMSQIDNQNTFLSIMLVLNAIYSFIYFYYSSNKKRFIIETILTIFLIYGILTYTDSLEIEDGVKCIGRVASFSNSLRFVPAFADIYNVIKIKTTENVPFQQTVAFAFILSQFLTHSLLTGNYYRMYTQIAGLSTIAIYFVLYIVYPPQTWKVPILGVGAKESKKDN